MMLTTAAPANSSLASATPVNFKMTRYIKKFLSVKSILAGFGLGLFALTAPAQTPMALGNMPLYFEANPGQAGSPARFLARGRDAQFLIAPTETQFILRKSATESATVRMQFIGANVQAQISGDAELAGKINYLTGNNPAQWRSGIPTFSKIRIEEIYPGIGLIYYGNQRQLEYDFDIATGANPNAIAIRFDGADKISLNAQGGLTLALGNDETRQPKPLIYQTSGGVQKEISGGYKILDSHTVAFSVGKYDSALPLVIDPILSYSTFFGGTLGETAWAVAVNTNDGSIYIAGQTFSKLHLTNGVVVSPFSTNGSFSTTGAFQTNFMGGTMAGDAFVAHFENPGIGTNLLYLTYLGGSGDDAAYGLAVDNAGNAFVTGATDSTNFPVTNSIPGGVPGIVNSTNIGGSFDKAIGSHPADAFVAELNTNGSQLIYSTYLGGEAPDAGYGIAVDSADNAYVTGFTYSTNFPVTANAPQRHLACTNSFDINANAFVSEIAANGAALVFSTYLGGTNFDQGQGIAVDSGNYIYLPGFTSSTNFPTFKYISQTIGTNLYNGNVFNSPTNTSSLDDAFVTKYYPSGTNSSGSNYVYSTYLGGVGADGANHIAVDGGGAAYVTGWTTSTNFPNTATNVPGLYSFVATNIQFFTFATNVFLTKITNDAGTSAGIDYSVVFGGYKSDVGNGVAVDPAGNAFVVGTTSSTNFPVYNNLGLLRATNSGGNDVFVTAFNPDASALLYSAYLGGKKDDFGYSIAVDPADNAYVVGETSSTNFPATIVSTNFPVYNAWQLQRNGSNDTFLAVISTAQFQPSLLITPTPTNKVILTWIEPEMSSYKVESNTNLITTNWMTLTNAVSSSNDWRTVTLPSTNKTDFFRLHAF